MNVPHAIQNNPPMVAAGLTGLLAVFLSDLLQWALSVIPDTVPTAVTTSGSALAMALIGALIGKLAQSHTWPDWKVQAEFIRPVTDEEHWSVPINETQDYT